MTYKDTAADNLNERIKCEIERMLCVEPFKSGSFENPASYEDIETEHLRYLTD